MNKLDFILENTLEELFPNIRHCSRATLYNAGFNYGIITEDEWQNAKNYYGRLWHYCGD